MPQAARNIYVSAVTVADDDAALHCFALEFHILRGIEPVPVSAPDGIDCEGFFTARARRRAVTGQILAIRPLTTGERQAQARVVVALVEDGEFPIHAAPTVYPRLTRVGQHHESLQQ